MEQRSVKLSVNFIFSNFQNIIIKKILVYTGMDDGLAIFKNVNSSKAEKTKKDIQTLFKDNHLNLTIQCNVKTANYLDVTFNLSNATYQPFCKPNNKITYTYKESNHTLSIFRQIPLSIESQLSKYSSDEKIFKKSSRTRNFTLKTTALLTI